MKPPTRHESTKPFDIRERLRLFAEEVVLTAQKLQRQDEIANALSVQLAQAAVSAAANAEEADDGSSERDFLAKELICLRELKESRVRLNVLRSTGYLDSGGDSLVQESEQLVRIVAAIIRNKKLSAAKKQAAASAASTLRRKRTG